MINIKFLPEFLPKRNIWVIIPTIIYFGKGTLDEDDKATDLTFSWLCFGLTLRF